MADPLKFYEYIDKFLAEKGFYAHLSRAQVDGHMLRHYIAEIKNLACSQTGCCVEENVRNLLQHMTKVPGWTNTHRLSALKAGSFPPNFA